MRFLSQVAKALSNSSGPLTIDREQLDFQRFGGGPNDLDHGNWLLIRWDLGSEQQQARSRQRRSDLLEHLQPLGQQFRGEERRSCDISAGMGETGDQSRGSAPAAKTIGIVDVVCRAANTPAA